MMPSVVLFVRGPAQDRPPHRKATLANERSSFTFPIINSESELADLAQVWVEQPRPNRVPITRPGPRRLSRYPLRALLVTDSPQGSVDDQILQLRAMATASQPVALSYGYHSNHALLTSSGHWLITDLKVRVLTRRQGSNDAARAEATIELLEANIPKWRAPSSMARSAPSAAVNLLFPVATSTSEALATAGGATGRSVVAVAGDTLYSIALRVFGNGDLWRAIGDLNGIADPRTVTSGQVLRVP